MSARLLATLCLFVAWVSVGRAESPAAADSRLVVYLKTAAGQPSAPIEQMKRELASILRIAGYDVEWLAPEERADAPFIAVVTLDGVCSSDAPPALSSGALALATTPVADGHVLPFSTLHCGALWAAITPALTGRPAAARDFLLGRAMARVAAHELYHVLAGTKEHGESGIARSCYRPADLVAESFEFETASLNRMRPAATVTDDAFGEDATGRD